MASNYNAMIGADDFFKPSELKLWLLLLGEYMQAFENYRELERQIKVRLLTCEAEILFNLSLEPLTAGELQTRSKNSSTSFYMTLKRLHQMKLIVGTESPTDKRRIVYRLAAELEPAVTRVRASMAAL